MNHNAWHYIGSKNSWHVENLVYMQKLLGIQGLSLLPSDTK